MSRLALVCLNTGAFAILGAQAQVTSLRAKSLAQIDCLVLNLLSIPLKIEHSFECGARHQVSSG